MALRRILGDHVHQAGSLVAPDHLRFDFTHWQRVEPEQLGEIERIVNGVVCGDHEVDYFATAFVEAQRLGAMALFGEKYGETVRVVRIGGEERPLSLELCGGCHVRRTGQIGPFVITSEGSIASGVRRIEARTGGAAVQVMQEQRSSLQQVSALLGGGAGEVAQRTGELVQHARQLEKRVKALEAERSAQQAKLLASEAEEIGGVRLILRTFDDQQPPPSRPSPNGCAPPRRARWPSWRPTLGGDWRSPARQRRPRHGGSRHLGVGRGQAGRGQGRRRRWRPVPPWPRPAPGKPPISTRCSAACARISRRATAAVRHRETAPRAGKPCSMPYAPTWREGLGNEALSVFEYEGGYRLGTLLFPFRNHQIGYPVDDLLYAHVVPHLPVTT